MPPEQNINITTGDQKSNGALIGTIVIIIILLVGGIYLWKKGMAERSQNSNGNTAQVEGELNSMDLDNLDQGI
jgi:hypothetical protein